MAMVEPYNAIPYPALVKNILLPGTPHAEANWTRICGSESTATDGGDGHTKLYAYNGTAWKGVEEAYVIDESEQWNRIATGFNEFERKSDGETPVPGYIPNGESTPHADGWYEVTSAEQVNTSSVGLEWASNSISVVAGGDISESHTIGHIRVVMSMECPEADGSGIGTGGTDSNNSPAVFAFSIKPPGGAGGYGTVIWPGYKTAQVGNSYLSTIFGGSQSSGWKRTFVFDSRANSIGGEDAAWDGAHSIQRWLYDGSDWRGSGTDNAFVPAREDLLSGYGDDNRTTPVYPFFEINEGGINWSGPIFLNTNTNSFGIDEFIGKSVTGSWIFNIYKTELGEKWRTRTRVYIKPE